MATQDVADYGTLGLVTGIIGIVLGLFNTAYLLFRQRARVKLDLLSYGYHGDSKVTWLEIQLYAHNTGNDSTSITELNCRLVLDNISHGGILYRLEDHRLSQQAKQRLRGEPLIKTEAYLPQILLAHSSERFVADIVFENVSIPSQELMFVLELVHTHGRTRQIGIAKHL
jgi:hypothetical protein